MLRQLLSDATGILPSEIRFDLGKDGKPSKVLGVPVKLSETPGAIRTAAVEFGENTSAVLTELGYSKEEIKTFEKEGII